MKRPFASHATGWIVLAGLVAFFPQLAGCDTTAPTQKIGGGATEAPQTPSPNDTHKPSNQERPDAKAEALTPPTEVEKNPSDSETSQSTSVSKTPDASPLVKRLVIASDVQEREPIEIEGAKVKDPVVAFLELKHNGKEESGIVVTFEHESGKKVGFVELKVPAESPRFRTWARTRNISEAGEWTAVIRSQSGEELARKSFTVAG